jgi:hypothetical protein
LRHTSPIFSSDVPQRTQKLARLELNYLPFGLKTADLNSYLNFLSKSTNASGTSCSAFGKIICVSLALVHWWLDAKQMSAKRFEEVRFWMVSLFWFACGKIGSGLPALRYWWFDN